MMNTERLQFELQLISIKSDKLISGVRVGWRRGTKRVATVKQLDVGTSETEIGECLTMITSLKKREACFVSKVTEVEILKEKSVLGALSINLADFTTAYSEKTRTGSLPIQGSKMTL